MKIAVERATREDAVHIACTVDFELVDAVFADKVERHPAKPSVVLRAGESKSARIGFIAVLTPVLQPRLFCFVIATPGREPDPGCRAVTRGRSGQRAESLGETRIEAPQCARIIPTVVEEKGVQLYIPFFRQFLSERMDDIKRVGLVVRAFIT